MVLATGSMLSEFSCSVTALRKIVSANHLPGKRDARAGLDAPTRSGVNALGDKLILQPDFLNILPDIRVTGGFFGEGRPMWIATEINMLEVSGK